MKYTGLVLGDLITLAVITLLGFASHGELGPSFTPRILASFIPLCVGWYLLAPTIGLYDEARVSEASALWRPAFAMLFAGPLAALLRGIILNVLILPSFAVILTVTAAIGLTLWRSIWLMIRRRTGPPPHNVS